MRVFSTKKFAHLPAELQGEEIGSFGWLSAGLCAVLSTRVPGERFMSRTSEQLEQDRRFARRSSAALSVYLSGESKSGRGTTRDISRRGVFVQTNGRGYFPGARVVLTFVLKECRVIKLRRYSAIVTRRSAGGVGLKFCGAGRS